MRPMDRVLRAQRFPYGRGTIDMTPVEFAEEQRHTAAYLRGWFDDEFAVRVRAVCHHDAAGYVSWSEVQDPGNFEPRA